MNIPQAFTFYNNKYLFKESFMSRMMYLMQLGKFQNRKPMLVSQCVACGKCMKHCPQNINIPDELKKVEKEFEGFLAKPILFLATSMFSRGQRKKGSESSLQAGKTR